MQGATHPILADVTDPAHPRTICSLTGHGVPQLVTQTMISWYSTQGGPGSPGASVIGTLDLLSGVSALVTSWQGGGFMDGLFTWSPDQSLLAYVTSDAGAVNLHLSSGGGDRVVSSMGAVPGRGVNPSEDDAYLGFSQDGAYFALVQTFSSTGDHLQVRKASDGSLAYSQPGGTMATWGSSGSRLYFRQLQAKVIYAWDSSAGLTQAFGQELAWIQPRADVGDDYLAFTVRDAPGTPHVWTYGHGGRAGGQLPNIRSSPVFLTATSVFYVEEAPCGPNCGIGPATQPDGKTFTYDLGRQVEAPSLISAVYGSWPRLGQL